MSNIESISFNRPDGVTVTLTGQPATSGQSEGFDMPTLSIECMGESNGVIEYKIPPTQYSPSLSALMNNVGKVKDVIVQRGQSIGMSGQSSMIVAGFTVYAQHTGSTKPA